MVILSVRKAVSLPFVLQKTKLSSITGWKIKLNETHLDNAHKNNCPGDDQCMVLKLPQNLYNYFVNEHATHWQVSTLGQILYLF